MKMSHILILAGLGAGYYFLIHKPKKDVKEVMKAAVAANQVKNAEHQAKVAMLEGTTLGGPDYGSLGSYDGSGSLGSCGFGSLC
jgi:hypothetical protein